MLLAVLFGQLTRRVPNADGGLYAYARHESGDFAGYLTGWCYWIQAWAGNAAIVSAWVFYVEALFGITHPSAMTSWGIALAGLWVPAAVNLAGARQMAWFQNLTVVLKFLPLLFVGVVGWFFVSSGHFGAFNASGGSLYSAIGIAAGVALFSGAAARSGRTLTQDPPAQPPTRWPAGLARPAGGATKQADGPWTLQKQPFGSGPWPAPTPTVVTGSPSGICARVYQLARRLAGASRIVRLGK